ncbi:LysR substrate-binding domain-containing protein [Pseudomonas sp. BGr12]|uniref:LysR substrate-binding domain-containing protein n=1 Tax=Pseudomonas sp. BGr12 TaxID=2936269 RepID=UPI00255A3230|nr:LysR substrate-binding domain-containing protein [Pseudomonas sp. BJa5]MDL2428404.1 LysR substrate-binding domain-containing protein [Pseudomonas sp. BJa5]
MELKQLKYFSAIVENGSFSKAADALHISQPSLSQQILNLEDELSTSLLVRSAAGVKATMAGEILHRHARQMLRQAEAIRSDVLNVSAHLTGTVAVGFPTTIAAVLAVPLFEQVRTLYPGIRLQIFESMSGYVSEMLASGRLDIAVLFRTEARRGTALMQLFDEWLYVIGNHPTLDDLDATCPLSRLDNVPMVAPTPEVTLRVLITKAFERAGIELNIVANIDSLNTMLEIVEKGSVCAILPASSVVLRPSSNFTKRKIIESEIMRPISVCWPASQPRSAASTAVCELIGLLFRDLHEKGEWEGVAKIYPRPVD